MVDIEELGKEPDEGYGVETDDWMMDETRKEFISFSQSPGAIIIALTGKPTKERSKYGKDQFWFPCIEMVGKEGVYSLEDRILSTASHQLRKKLTKFYNDHPDNIFKGEIPILITWEGDGMNRYYALQLCNDELDGYFTDLRIKH